MNNEKHLHVMISTQLHEKFNSKLPERRLKSLVLRQLIREYVNGNIVLNFDDFKE